MKDYTSKKEEEFGAWSRIKVVLFTTGLSAIIFAIGYAIFNC